MSVYPSSSYSGIMSVLPLSGQPRPSGYSASLGNQLVRMTTAVPSAAILSFSTPTPLYWVTTGKPREVIGYFTAPPLRGTTPTTGQTPSPAFAKVNSSFLHHVEWDWFEKLHIVPREVDFGLVLASVSVSVEIYNAFRYSSSTLSSITNNPALGTPLSGIPSLSYVLQAQDGLVFSVGVDVTGPPVVSNTILFSFSSGTVSLPVSATRIVLLGLIPETPFLERLEGNVDVLESLDGSEQRISLRKIPRQIFDVEYSIDETLKRQVFMNSLFGWQGQVFGLPMWQEPMFLTSPVSAGSSSVPVVTTAYSDVRVGGMCLVSDGEDRQEVAVIDSISGSSVTLKAPLSLSYSSSAVVLPVRNVVASNEIKEKHQILNFSTYSMSLSSLDNTVDFSSTTGWSTYKDYVILDDPNVVERTLAGTNLSRIQRIDPGFGSFSLAQHWDRPKHFSTKTFLTKSHEALWKVRCLLHHLKIAQKPFWLPTFVNEVTLAQAYSSGSSSLFIKNVGYTLHCDGKFPKRDLRIVLKDGTVYTTTITNAAIVDSTKEELTISPTIPDTILAADVHMIQMLELVRINSDTVTFKHENSRGQATISFPVKVVFDEL